MNRLYLGLKKNVFPDKTDWIKMYKLLKIISITLLFAFGFWGEGFAQRFKGKIIGGINGAQIDGDGFGGFNRGGLLAGVGAAFKIDDHWSIGPEFLFSGKGSQVTLDQFNELGIPPIKYKLNYIDLPIIASYAVRERFGVLVGLSFNYLLSAEIDPGTNLEPYDGMPYFKRMDYQVLAGMEYEVFDNIWLQGRWSYSAISINAIGTTSPGFPSVTGQRGGMFNNLLQFSLRYVLDLDK
jgi:hypothetical protein